MKINGHIIKPKADLRGSNLRKTDLSGADLRRADLYKADLYKADLRGAELRGANLCGADLYKADLRGADLDLSVFPLWCGSFGLKTDTRLVWQLIAHITRLDTSKTSEKAKEAIKALMPYANDFCRYRKDVDKI